MENRSPSLLSRHERETRSPFLASVQAEREREFARRRRWLPWSIALVAVAMVANLAVIALFLNGRFM